MSVIVEEIENQTNQEGQLLETKEGVPLFIPSSLDKTSVGDCLNLRGISFLSSLGYIEVTELHIHDYPISGFSRSLLHSIPGILAFVIIFFLVFKFDTSRLRFTPGRD